MQPIPPLTIAVHGATGTQGAPVVQALEAAGHTVVALSRATVDPADPSALARVYASADAAVVSLPLLFGPDVLRLAESIATALHSSAPPRVVFNPNGPYPREVVGVPFLDARARLAALVRDLPGGSVVRPAATYMENLSAPWSLRRVTELGVVAYPVAREVPLPWTALEDYADVVADVLADPSPPAELVVAGAPLTGDEVAAELSAALGRAVRWESLDPGEYGERMRPFAGDDAADGIASLYSASAGGPPPEPEPAPLHAAPTPLRAWAERHIALAPAPA